MTCKNCRHLDKRDEKMLAQSFARCHLLPRWEYHAPTWSCSKWSKKA